MRNVEDIIAPSLIGKAYRVDTDLKKIDALMRNLDDGLRSKNKGRLGANATLGVSMACARAGAAVAVCIYFNPSLIESLLLLFLLFFSESLLLIILGCTIVRISSP